MKIVGFVVASLVAVAPLSAAPPAYKVTGSIQAGDGGWDYSSVDPETNQFFIARTDAVTAIDLGTGKANDHFTTAQRAHSALPIPGTGALLETDGTTNSVRLIDTRTGVVRWTLQTGEKPDGAIWDPSLRRAIIMHNKGGTVAVVDVDHAKLLGSVAVAPGLEGAAFDKRGLLWVNSEELNKVIPVDLNTMKALEPVTLPGCDGATGLIYAAKQDQLLSVCGGGQAFVVNAATHKVIAQYSIGKGADAAMLDEARAVAAVPCGDGTLAFFSLSGDAIIPVGTVATEKGARSGAVDPRNGTIYLPTARFNPPATPGGRRTLVPGSFHVLIVTPTR